MVSLLLESKTLCLNINIFFRKHFPKQKHDFESDSKGLFSGDKMNCNFPERYLDDLFSPDMMSQQAIINVRW